MTHAKRVLTLLLSGALLGAATPARAVVQEYQTLELVRTYTEEEIQGAYPDLFPTPAIKDEGDVISFYDPQTKTLLKQLKKDRSRNVREERNPHGDGTTIWEKYVDYEISGDATFMLFTEFETGRNKETGADLEGVGAFPRKRLLYNGKGDVVAELPHEVNMIRFSPDQQNFIAFGEDEVPSEFMYFYSIDGTVLAKEKLKDSPLVKYTQQGEFLAVFDSFGRQFSIFSNTGKRIYEGDYTALIHNVNPILYGVFPSEDGSSFLLNTSEKILLFSINNTLLWESPSSLVIGCTFDHTRNRMRILSVCNACNVPDKKDIYQVEVRDRNSGELLDRIENVIQARFLPDITIIQKEGGYYEYTIHQ